MMTTLQYRGDIASDGSIVPFRVAACDSISPVAIQQLQSTPGIEVIDDPLQAQGLLIRSATKFLLQGDFEKYQHLMYLVRVGVGTDNIDMKCASDAGIATVNTPGASTRAVAQRAVTFMLDYAARTVQGTQALAKKNWSRGEKNTEPIDLSERTLGIIGFGRIGQETKRLAEPYFRRIVFTDVRNIEGKIDLIDLLRECDIVSVHVAGSAEVLSAEHISLLKPQALLVNTARGEVVNTEAILQRMDAGLHVALDVFPVEGVNMFQDSLIARIVEHPNFIGTPHTAASDLVTQRKLGLEGVERMKEFAQQGIVNPFDLAGHTLPRVAPAEPKMPGIRGILTHRSIPGVLATITGVIAEFGGNIRELVNEEGDINNGTRLAMTTFDLTDGKKDVALNIMNAITSNLESHQKRLLCFS
ncbi:hypothetical protein HYZ98_02645 [Candidatus Peregrinibacteria bacterium]|nr:hypothetical protein [Candidatus Peregrinibacteria bacterium]